MKSYFFLILSFSLIYSSCFQDCVSQDVKVGSVSLMPTTKAFMQKFVGKKVIYKNENGQEMIFKDTSVNGITKDTDRLDVTQNCKTGLIRRSQSWDFVERERIGLSLVSDSFVLNYIMWLTQDFSKKADSSLLFDVINCSVNNKKLFCGISTRAIFSDRGFPSRLTDTTGAFMQFKAVRDTLIGSKRFQNINVKLQANNQLCEDRDTPNNQTPVEVFFNLKDGVVAFRTLAGEFWFFDRIE